MELFKHTKFFCMILMTLLTTALAEHYFSPLVPMCNVYRTSVQSFRLTKEKEKYPSLKEQFSQLF